MTKRRAVRCAHAVPLAAIAALALAGAPAAQAAIGLAGEWRLDEGAGLLTRDSSDGGHDGQLGPGLATPQWVGGVDGSALHFDGSDEVRMPDTAGLEPARITVEAWVRNAGAPGSYRYIVSKGATACQASSYGIYTGSSQGLAFYVSGPSGYVVSAQAPAAAAWDGAWHHVAGTYDGVNVRLFVDGAEIGKGRPGPESIAYGLPSKNLLLGTYRGACDLPFNGDIDSVRIWNLALTRDEVSTAREQPQGRPAPNLEGPRPGTPAEPGTSSSAPGAACLTLASSRTRVPLGRRTTVTVTVRKGRRPSARVRVVLTGKGVRTTVRRTDRKGRARFVVRPRHKVTLRLRALGQRPSCGRPVASVRAG